MRGEFLKLNNLVARNIKLYFKDKMIFFVSLITPMILVVLFLTFLGGVYRESLISCLPEGVNIADNLVNAFTGGWLFSSILATSCITVAFCSNMIVYDKVNKAKQDFQITPVKKSTLQISYVISNFITTFIICMAVFIVSLIYLGIAGWFLSFVDILLILVDMLLLILFGTLLSSFIGMFVSSQGAHSAICTLVSSMYGFLCGAYMPINSFAEGVRAFIGFMPGTYATVLFRSSYMNGVLGEIGKTVPEEAVVFIRQGFDGKMTFFGHDVQIWVMFLVLICSCLVLFGLFILVASLKGKKFNKKQKVEIKG